MSVRKRKMPLREVRLRFKWIHFGKIFDSCYGIVFINIIKQTKWLQCLKNGLSLSLFGFWPSPYTSTHSETFNNVSFDCLLEISIFLWRFPLIFLDVFSGVFKLCFIGAFKFPEISIELLVDTFVFFRFVLLFFSNVPVWWYDPLLFFLLLSYGTGLFWPKYAFYFYFSWVFAVGS